MLLFALLFACAAEAPPPPAAVAAPTHPNDALDALDPRAPLPLLPRMALHQKEQMRGHLEAVQALTAALAIDDMAQAEAAAVRLGSSPQMNMTCEHMGAGAEGFTEQALQFHQLADTIAEAARAGDRAKTLQATADTLSACAACHAAWRQEVVEVM